MRALRSARGQAAVEYLMLLGMMTAVGIGLLAILVLPVRRSMQHTVQCVISDECSGFSWLGAMASAATYPLRAASVQAVSWVRASDWREHTVDTVVVTAYRAARAVGLLDDFKAANRDLHQYDLPQLNAVECASGVTSRCDGEIVFSEARAGSTASLIMVNGINTDPHGWRDECARESAAVANRDVTCVYNATNGIITDLSESAALLDAVRRGESPSFSGNLAVQQLKKQISGRLAGTGGEVRLVGHSEGAVLLAVALWQMRAAGAIREEDWRRIDVVVLGGAERRFPPELGSISSLALVNDATGERDIVAAIGQQEYWDHDDVPRIAEVRAFDVVSRCRGLDGCHHLTTYLEAVRVNDPLLTRIRTQYLNASARH